MLYNFYDMKFIWGEEGYLINKEVDKAKKQYYNLTPIVFSDNESIENIIEEIATPSLFGEDKLLIIKNHEALIKDGEYKELIEELSRAKNIHIVFSLEASKLSSKNKLVNFLLKEAKVQKVESLDPKNVLYTIKELVHEKKGQIDNQALMLLSSKIPTDLRIIVNEVEKLLLEDDHITYDMVDRSIGEYVKHDAFALVNSITNADVFSTFNSYYKLKLEGIDIVTMIAQISSIFSLALKVKAYKNQGYANKDIATKLNVHIFRVKKAGEIVTSHNDLSIQEKVKKLATLESDIKTGMVDATLGFEKFLLDIVE